MKLKASLIPMFLALLLSMQPSGFAPQLGSGEGSPVSASPHPPSSAAQGASETKSSRGQLPAAQGTLRVTTTLVEVNVVVRDKHGEPVRDLKPEDFELFDQGKPQKIQLFALPPAGASLISGGQVASPSPVPPADGLRATARTYTNRNPGGPERSGVTVILIDPMDLWCTEWPRARDQVIQFLRQVSPGDRIGIYLMNWSGISILHDVTQDSSSLIKQLASWNGQFDQHQRPCSALEALSMTYVGNDFSFLRHVSDPVPGAAGARNSFDSSFLGAGKLNPTTEPTIMKLKLFETIAHHLAAVPGRKNVLWLSDGFPISGFTTGPTGEAEAYSYGLEEEEAMRVMNQANVAIYSFDVGGLRVGGDPLSPSLPAPPIDVVAASKDEPHAQQKHARQIGQTGEMTTQLALEEISQDTGGRSYLNTNDLAGAMQNASYDSRATYTLGFYPEQPRFRGEFHQLQVKVKSRRDLTLNYRKGYVDAPAVDDIKSELQGAAWSPFDANGVGVTAALTPGKAGNYELSVTISLDGLRLEPDGKRWKGTIHVVLVQKDNEGRLYNSVDQAVNLTLRPETYRKMQASGFGFHEKVALNPKATSLRVIVLDENSRNLGSVTIPVTSSN